MYNDYEPDPPTPTWKVALLTLPLAAVILLLMHLLGAFR
jgi:hypothetical protein